MNAAWRMCELLLEGVVTQMGRGRGASRWSFRVRPATQVFGPQ